MDEFIQIRQSFFRRTIFYMANRPLQHYLRIPAYFQNLAVNSHCIAELIQCSEAISFGYQWLDVSRLNLQTFIEIFKSIIVSMQFCKDFGSKDESIKVLGEVLKRVGKLNIKIFTTKRASS